MNPGVTHEPTPAASEPAGAITQPRYFASTESRHDIVCPCWNAPPAVSTEFHHASPPPAPATEAGLPKPGSVLCPPCRQGAQSRAERRPGQRRKRRQRVARALQKRVVWAFDSETRRWPGGWDVSTQMLDSCAWDSVARRGIYGVGADSAGTACDAREVATAGVDDDRAVGKIGVGMLTVEEERSQRRTSPSKPPERRMGCTESRRCVSPWGLNSKIGRTTDLFLMSTQDNPHLHRTNIEYPHRLVTRCMCEQGPRSASAYMSYSRPMDKNMYHTSFGPLRPIMSAIMVVRTSDRSLL
jgi:hypothetical protein